MRIFYLLIALLSLASCDRKLPKPTDTFVRMDMEDEGHSDLKMRWLDLLHGGPNSNWKEIEYENSLERLRYLDGLKDPSRDGEETLANGNIYGKWLERGSTNQAGSILNFDYDKDNDLLYAITAGGSIFRGSIYGLTWEVVNDDLVFNSEMMEVLTLPNGGKRLIAAISHIPHYSDDEGKTWTPASGVVAESGRQMEESKRYQGKIFMVYKQSSGSRYSLYISNDNGASYQKRESFTYIDNGGLAMTTSSTGDSLYIMEKLNTTTGKLYHYDIMQDKLNLKGLSKIKYETVNLHIEKRGNQLIHYAYNDNFEMMTSTDGINWELISSLPLKPWNVGFFMVPSAPQNFIMGEVDAYRTSQSGKQWTIVNNWWEYYGDPIYQLHADIMVIKEFEEQDGKKVVLIGHHGGISKTYDYGLTTENITTFNMFNSQYYDTKTLPSDQNYVFSGAQDQGMQRGILPDEIPMDMDQMISGDYGHITFTNQGKHMWIVYPGGSVSFYDNPKIQSWPNANFQIENENPNAWIPQIIADPHSDEDVVYLAGGNHTSSGNKIIKLRYNGLDIVASELSYNFGNGISAMAISPLQSNLWYAMTDNGQFFKSIDSGNSWKKTFNSLSNGHYLYGACILPSAMDTNVVYISGSGYGPAPVYKSIDGGSFFSRMREGMPSTVAFEIAANEDESKIYAATEAGPYVYIKEKMKWFPLSGKLTPNQTYWSVEYLPQSKTTRFSTYGRGVWDFRDLGLPLATKQPKGKDITLKIFPNPAQNHLNVESEIRFDYATIIDQNGKAVLKVSTLDQIDISNLSAGIYFIIASNKETKIKKKFIKI